MEFYEAFWFLLTHPIFENNFLDCADFDAVKVNPATNRIDNDKALNTKTQIWIECGPFDENIFCHDMDLDCGGDTFEEAICRLAELVRKKYGTPSEEELIKNYDGRMNRRSMARVLGI